MSSKAARRRQRAQQGKGAGGGSLSGLRTGFKGMVGSRGSGGASAKESLLSRVLTYVLAAAAAGLLIYRFSR